MLSLLLTSSSSQLFFFSSRLFCADHSSGTVQGSAHQRRAHSLSSLQALDSFISTNESPFSFWAAAVPRRCPVRGSKVTRDKTRSNTRNIHWSVRKYLAYRLHSFHSTRSVPFLLLLPRFSHQSLWLCPRNGTKHDIPSRSPQPPHLFPVLPLLIMAHATVVSSCLYLKFATMFQAPPASSSLSLASLHWLV